MRTQGRYFLLTLSIMIFLLPLVSLSQSYADKGIFYCRKCSKKKCIANPAIAKDCFENCANHGGADCKDTMDAAAQGASDQGYNKGLHNIFFAALKAEGGGSLQVNPNADEHTIAAAIKKEIKGLLKQWDAKYIRRTFKKTPAAIKTLVKACKEKPGANCGIYKDEALFRRTFCPPSTLKDCDKAFSKNKEFVNQELKIHLESNAQDALANDQ
jgi:hypothetical protein